MKLNTVIFIALLTAACSDHSNFNGSGSNAGSTSYYPDVNWPNIHRDAGNTDSIPSDGATDLGAAASSVLIDRYSNLYIGDTSHMRSYDATGGLRWETPIMAWYFLLRPRAHYRVFAKSKMYGLTTRVVTAHG